MKTQLITKSKFISGDQCIKKLWLDCNKEYQFEETIPGSIFDIGNKIGVMATQLFEGGVLLGSEYSQKEAINKTKELMEDLETSAIFEAAFTYKNTLVRVDILARDNEKQWRLIEVKSSKKPGAHHFLDAAFQAWVLNNAGVKLTSVEIAHPDADYVKETDDIDLNRYIKFDDITEKARGLAEGIEPILDLMFDMIKEDKPPEIIPFKSRCNTPYSCDYWHDCTKDKPHDWVQKIYYFGSKQVEGLAEQGIESISQLPTEFEFKGKHKPVQEREVSVISNSQAIISKDLITALSSFGPPAYYLDFEYTQSTIPLFNGLKTGELIAFQWSCHFVSKHDELLSMSLDDMLKLGSEDADVFHREFLGNSEDEPSNECARNLLEVVGNNDYPIIVYHDTAEKSAIKSLAHRCPEYRDQLLALIPRLKDLLVLVRENTCLPEFFKKPLGLGAGTYSIKTTAHAFCPEFDYANLEGVAQGGAAMEAYYRIVTGEFMAGENEASLREALLKYCKYDTVAMMVLHKELIRHG